MAGCSSFSKWFEQDIFDGFCTGCGGIDESLSGGDGGFCGDSDALAERLGGLVNCLADGIPHPIGCLG